MEQGTSQEILMRDDDFIVSKTNPKGQITYGNRIFMEFSGYQEKEVLGQPHNIIRHPDMPRAVFRLLWKTLQQGNEFFGIIKNRSRGGEFYWTFAHVTPSHDTNAKLLGYYSVRRCPKRSSIETVQPLYEQMRQIEQQQQGSRDAMEASVEFLHQHILSRGKTYNEFILSLEN